MSKHEVPMDWEKKSWDELTEADLDAMKAAGAEEQLKKKYNRAMMSSQPLITWLENMNAPKERSACPPPPFAPTRWQRFTNYLRRKLRQFREWGV